MLIACDREIPYNGEYQNPQLAIEAHLEEGSSAITGTLIHSTFFAENVRAKRDRWLDGDVTFVVQRDNGEEMAYSSESDEGVVFQGYEFSIPLVEPLRIGEKVRVKASHQGYPSVEGSDIIVARPQVSCIEAVLDSANYLYHFILQFGENANITGMIGISGVFNYWTRPEKENAYHQSTSFITSDNSCFAGTENAYSTDWGFNSWRDLFCSIENLRNKEVEIVMPLNRMTKVNYDLMEDITLKVTCYSEDSYRYRRSLLAYYGMSGESDNTYELDSFFGGIFGVEETVQVYSNVENGIGIVHAHSSVIFKKVFSE